MVAMYFVLVVLYFLFVRLVLFAVRVGQRQEVGPYVLSDVRAVERDFHCRPACIVRSCHAPTPSSSTGGAGY